MASQSLTTALQETLDVFERDGVPLTTSEVTDSLDVGRRSTYERLERLADRGHLETKKVGASARVWWRSPDAGYSSADAAPGTGDASWDDAIPNGTGHVDSDADSRQANEVFAELIDAIEEYAIFSLDADGHVRSWNPGAEQIKGYEADEILGRHFSTFYTESDVEAGVPEQNLTAAAERGSVEDEGWRVRADGTRFWANVTITAMHDAEGTLQGFAKVTCDMTARREYEETLEEQAHRLKRQRDEFENELDTVFERISDGFYALNEELRFLYLNDHAAEIMGLDESAIGRPFFDEVAATDSFEAALQEALDTQEPVIMEDYYEPVDRWFSNAIYPSESGLSVYFRDVTDRKEREQELAQYATLFEEAKDVNVIVEPDGTFRYLTPSVENVFGYEQAELVGEVGFEYIHPEDRDEAAAEFAKMLETPGYEPEIEFRFERGDGSWIVLEALARDLRDDPDIEGIVIYTREVTQRKERERELERAIDLLHKTERTADVGGWEIDTETMGVFWTDGIFDILDLPDEEPSLDEALDMYHEDDREQVENAIESALDDATPFDVEARIRTHSGEMRWLRIQGVPETVDGKVVTLRGAAQDVTERKERERELQRQREELATLNNLNTIVSEITETVIGKSTREEIETAVCEALAATDSYEFAWLAGIDSKGNTFEPRATAETDGYAEEITVSLDPNDPTSRGPAGTAIREGETQVVRDVFADPDFEPWRDIAAEYGFSSLAAIPIVHRGTVYGVLGVYAARQNAFDTAERTVISRLGEVVGHAIASIERKRALMSEEVVELTFQIRNVFEALDLPVTFSGTITFDELVPVADDSFLIYGTATADAREGLATINDERSTWETITFYDEDGETRFELKLSEHPVLSTLASLGGSLEESIIEDGDYRLTVQLAPSADVNRFIDIVQEQYPAMEMVTRHQRVRTDDEGESDAVCEALTDSQRTALEAAYHSGFFEWPRDSAGEDVADSLGIAPPTFSQHLRKAQKKVVGAVLSADRA